MLKNLFFIINLILLFNLSFALEITIYNDDFAYIKDIRQFNLQKGANQKLSIVDLPKLLEVESFLLKGDIAIKEKIYNYDIFSLDNLFTKSIGKKVRVVVDGNNIEGVLLSYNNGLLLQTENTVLYLNKEKLTSIDFLEKKTDFNHKPSLDILADIAKSGRQNLELNYLTRGLSWQAYYHLELDQNDKKGNLVSFIKINNQSGLDYKNANIDLIAGEIKKENTRSSYYKSTSIMPESSLASDINTQEISDYYLYSLPKKLNLANMANKQVSFFTVENINLSKEYVLEMDYNAKNDNALIKYIINNKKDNQLGIAIPQGNIKVYKKDKGQRKQFIGEAALKNIAQNENIELTIGKAFDIFAEKNIKSEKSSFGNKTERVIEIKLKNQKKEAVEVLLKENFWQGVRVLRSSHKYSQKNARLVVIPVKIGAGQELIVEYTVIDS